MKCRQKQPRRLAIETLENREMLTAITPVSVTTEYPARATVSIEETFDTNHNGHLDDNDSVFICSGAMIGPSFVLTAAHCLYDSADGGFVKKIVIRPGRTPTNAPYGAISGINVTVTKAWTQGDKISDIGVIKLDKNIGNTVGWYGYKVASTSDLQNTTLNMRHYPGSPKSNGRQQFFSSGHASFVGPNVIYYPHNVISTFGGSSGAPVYFSATKQIVGIHVRGSLGQSGANQATRLTNPLFDFIQNYRKNHQSGAQSGWNGEVVGEVYDLNSKSFAGPQSAAASRQSEAVSGNSAAAAAVTTTGTSESGDESSATTPTKPSVASTIADGCDFTATTEVTAKKKDAFAEAKPVNKAAADSIFAEQADDLFAEPTLALL